MTPLYTSDRHFQFWSFVVSLKTLLIRSPVNDKEKNNIDIIFFGVKELHLASSIDSLTLFDGEMISDTRFEKRFEIQSGASTFFINALSASVYENQLDTFEFYHPVHGPDDLGKRLAKSS